MSEFNFFQTYKHLEGYQGKKLKYQIKLAKSAIIGTFIYMSEFPRHCTYKIITLRVYLDLWLYLKLA